MLLILAKTMSRPPQIATLSPELLLLPNTLFQTFYLHLSYFDSRVGVHLDCLEVLDGWILERI